MSRWICEVQGRWSVMVGLGHWLDPTGSKVLGWNQDSPNLCDSCHGWCCRHLILSLSLTLSSWAMVALGMSSLLPLLSHGDTVGVVCGQNHFCVRVIVIGGGCFIWWVIVRYAVTIFIIFVSVLVYDGLGVLSVVGVFVNLPVSQFIFLLIVTVAFALLLLGSAIVCLVLSMLVICNILVVIAIVLVWHCHLAYACHWSLLFLGFFFFPFMVSVSYLSSSLLCVLWLAACRPCFTVVRSCYHWGVAWTTIVGAAIGILDVIPISVFGLPCCQVNCFVRVVFCRYFLVAFGLICWFIVVSVVVGAAIETAGKHIFWRYGCM